MLPAAIGVTDVGRVRKVNEDAFACLEPFRFFVVADGMGGHKAGEVASRLAVEAMVAFISRSADSAEFSWPYGIEPTLSFEANRLRTAIHLANRRVFRAAEDLDEYTGMGTTVVSVLVSDATIVVGHVGDSRLYLWSAGRLQQLTKDDSWAMTILAQDAGDEVAAARSHPMKHVLTNVVGAREHADIHVAEHAVTHDDVLLLCTDGLHGAIDDDVIAAVLTREAADLDSAARTLVREALDAGGRDNVTVVLVPVGRG